VRQYGVDLKNAHIIHINNYPNITPIQAGEQRVREKSLGLSGKCIWG